MISKALKNESFVYFASFRYLLSTTVELAKLRAAWTIALESIQILRTRFIQTVDGYVQVALHNAELPWIETSISNHNEKDRVFLNQLEQWRAQNRSDFIRPFEVVILRTPEQAFLSLNIFHGLYDGNSLPMLLKCVYGYYQGDKDVIPGPPFQDVLPFGPLLSMPNAKNFWTGVVSSERVHRIPANFTQVLSKSGTSKAAAIFRDLQELENTRKKLGVTHQAVVQACLAVVLRKYYHGLIPLGLVASGRSINFEGADQVIGPMFNTIPFEMKINPTETWHSLAERCHKFNIAALPFQHTPLRDIQKWCKVPAEKQLFDFLFVFQKETAEAAKSDCNELWKLVDDRSDADYPLSFEAELKIDGSLAVTLVAQGQIADEALLERLVENFHQAVIDLIENPSAQISDSFEEITRNTINNGIKNPSPTTQSDHELDRNFVWSEEALILRREIVQLSAIDETEISEKVSIFELGLDSIDAIKLSSRLRKFDITLPVSQIMRHPSIMQMLQAIVGNIGSEKMSATKILMEQETRLRQHFQRSSDLSEDVEAILPATPLQEAMVAEMMNSNFLRYYNHDILKISANVDLEQLRRAWNLVYRGAQILRTEFCPVSDPSLPSSYAQVISRQGKSFWEELYLRETDDIQDVVGIIRDRAAQNPDEGNHFMLTKVQSLEDIFLIISLPHALYDGWSLTLLHHDVQEAYRGGQIESRPSTRTVLENIQLASSSEATDFWSDYLTDARPCSFRQLSNQPSPRVHRQDRKGSIPLNELRTFCKNQGITIQALGLTCWSLVLAAHVHSLEVVYGVVLSGRDTEDSQQVMFPTMNTVPFRVFVHGSAGGMLQYNHENMSEIRQFQHFPLRKAQALAKEAEGRLFDSLFLYQVRPDIGAIEGPMLYESVGGSSDVEYPVCVELEALGNNIIWRVACEDNIFDDQGTTDLLTQLDSTMNFLVEGPNDSVLSFSDDDVQICNLPPFSTSERSELFPKEDQSIATSANETELTVTEHKIRSVFSAVSGTPEEQISKHSTLFHIGLDSISAIKVSALLRKQSISLSVSNMLRSSTVERMADFVESQMGEAPKDISVPLHQTPSFDISILLQKSGLESAGLKEDNVEQVIAATSGQVYMLSRWENSHGRLFNDEFKFSISPSVEVEAILQGWANFIADNPLMRTIFVTTGGVEGEDCPFVQMVLQTTNSASSRIPMAARSAPSTDSDIPEVLTALDFLKTGQAIDGTLEQPFVRLRYSKAADGRWDLGLKIHHALYDGVSLPALLSSLRNRIEHAHAHERRPADLHPFAEFTAHSRLARSSEYARNFWVQYLRGSTSKPARSRRSFTDLSQRFAKYSPKLISNGQSLVSLAQDHGISLPSIFLAIYAQLWSTFKESTEKESTARDDTVIIGVYMANRDHDNNSLAVFPTVNLLPLRVNTQVAVLESASMIQKDLAQISESQNVSVGLWDIAKWTGVEVETFVNYLKLPGEGDEFRRDVYGMNESVDTDEGAKGKTNAGLVNGDMAHKLPVELRGNTVKGHYLVSSSISLSDSHANITSRLSMLKLHYVMQH
jgi:aryl carrier-like protein